MKNNPFTRFLSVALTAAMLVGVMPGAVLADAGEAIVGASSAVVESIPESTTPADAAPVATEVPPVTEPEATPEAAQPEASPEVEATPEATEQPETTPEATQEPEATPEATEQPETTPEATQEPEATPEATEQPEATPEATQEPEATPEATEEPETVDAQALLDELMALDDQAFLAAVDALTEEQAAALEALGEEALANLFARLDVLTAEPEDAPVDYNAMSVEELYAYLRSLTNDAVYMQVVGSLTAEKMEELWAYIDSISVGETFVVEQDNGVVDFLNAAPLVSAPRKMMMSRAALFSVPALRGYETTGQEPPEGLVMNKELTDYNSKTGKGKLKLEAYVTGDVESTESSQPVDIVLVLDQSGSMANGFTAAYEYTEVDYDWYTNEVIFENFNDYWDPTEYFVQGDDEKYYEVTIERTSKITGTEYNLIDNEQWTRISSLDGKYYFDGSVYHEIEVTEEGPWYAKTYTVTANGKPLYSDENTTVSRVPALTGQVYNKVDVEEYIYTYTWPAGVTVNGNTSDVSVGANGHPSVQLYTRSAAEIITRKEALTNAVTTFVQQVAAANEGNRIAIVGFGSASGDGNNTEILTLEGENSSYREDRYTIKVGQSYNTVKNNPYYYGNALVAANATIVKNAIKALAANGATRTDLGMELAAGILEYNQPTDGRKQVVVMFTDGEPTTYDYFDNDVASDTVNYANTIKNTYNATVYTVGIFNNADGSNPANAPNLEDSGTERNNKFMHAVSSNYPNAQPTSRGTYWYDRLGDPNPTLDGSADEAYYLSASNADALNQVFESISNEVGSASITLDSSTVLFDEMSPYFDVDTTGPIEVYKQEAMAIAEDGTVTSWGPKESVDLTPKSADGKVSVTGFDYSENYVAKVNGDVRGYKLVVEIPIQYDNAASFGGNNIPTNAKTSGIYNSDGSQCYGNFKVPAVNVPVNYEIGVQHQTIYISNAAQLDDLMKYARDFYTPDGVKNAFVDIEYTLKDGDVVIATLSIPHETSAGGQDWKPADGQTLTPSDLVDCKDYTISCTVTPVDRGYAEFGTQAVQKTCTPETATVHVLKPVITWQDTTKDYNAAISAEALTAENFVSVEWKDYTAEHTASAATALEPEPTLTYTFTLADSSPLPETITKELHVKVAVTANTMPLNGDNVKFDWQKNDASTGCTTSCVDPNPTYQFRIHLGTGTLIIYKTVSEFANNGKPVFDFKVTSQGEDGTVYYFHIDMTEKAADTPAEVEKITLPAGQYKVEELDNLNYPLLRVDGDIKDGIVAVGGTPRTVTFTNQGKDTNIPTDGSAAVNTFQTDSNGDYILSFKKEELGADPQTPAVGN